jgi:hypothetical protein
MSNTLGILVAVLIFALTAAGGAMVFRTGKGKTLIAVKDAELSQLHTERELLTRRLHDLEKANEGLGMTNKAQQIQLDELSEQVRILKELVQASGAVQDLREHIDIQHTEVLHRIGRIGQIGGAERSAK